jgi:hypothetical protein
MGWLWLYCFIFATRNKLYAFGYIAAVFFVLPGLLLGLTQMLD